MATGYAHVREASPTFVTNDEVLCSSVCQCCSFLFKKSTTIWKQDKSLAEIIEILRTKIS
jgi:hypothetical protein